MWLRWFLAILLGGSLLSSLWLYGAVEPSTYYPIFLILLLAAFPTLWRFPLGTFGAMRFLPLILLGSFLMLEITIQDTLVARGYLIIALGWLALFLTLAVTLESERTTSLVFLFLIFVGAAEALYGLSQSLESSIRYQARGTFINPNHFAGLLNMTLPLGFGLLYARFSRGFGERQGSELYAWAWLLLLSCSLMGLAIPLSRSRGGALTLASVLLFLSLMLTANRKDRDEGRLSGRAAWIVLFMILALGAWVGVDEFLSRFVGAGSTLDRRATLFRDSLGLLASNPVSGIGPAMYQWRFRPHQSLDTNLLFSNPYNDYLQSAVGVFLPFFCKAWCILTSNFPLI